MTAQNDKTPDPWMNLGTDLHPVFLNPASLLVSRLLIQANSGGGKSVTIQRLLIEALKTNIPFWVIDPEGEFSEFLDNSVRKSGVVVVSPAKKKRTLCLETLSPDCVDTPEELAPHLLECKTKSFIFDLSEFKSLQEKRDFVSGLLTGLNESPESFWKKLLVIIDEAHVFAPERSDKNSNPCKASVSCLMSTGRKRGFCGVLATQRLGKLAKDCVAECNNVLIGRTVLDIDVARACDTLGFSTKKDDKEKFKNLVPGEFFCFGPSFRNFCGGGAALFGLIKIKEPTWKDRHVVVLLEGNSNNNKNQQQQKNGIIELFLRSKPVTYIREYFRKCL